MLTRLAWAAALLIVVCGLPQGGAAQPAGRQVDGQGGATARPRDPKSDPTARLASALRLPEVVEVMRLEGLDYGKSLEDELFPGKGGSDWAAKVAALYDTAALTGEVERRLRAALPPASAQTALAFFASPPGQKVVSLEISARRAMLEPDVKAAADAELQRLIAGRDPRLAQITAFVQAGDLVRRNVAATMASNRAFYRGLVAAHAPGFEMTPAQIEAEVAGQEAGIRRETEAWLFPYLALAYAPLDDRELAAYVAFSRSPAGRALNAALFTALERTFRPVSEGLGRAAAGYLSGPAL